MYKAKIGFWISDTIPEPIKKEGEMRRLLKFKVNKQAVEIHIAADKIVAVRNFGECVRIYVDNTFFDVDNTLEEVLKEVQL